MMACNRIGQKVAEDVSGPGGMLRTRGGMIDPAGNFVAMDV